jgi:diaminopimelate epimerase
MHGAANDYVYIDCFVEPTPADPATLAVRIADRHRGVGGDGLILVEPSSRAAARMRMFNADGSESEMCGNGVRCVAHLVVARGRAPAGAVTIETGRGVLTVVVTPTGPRSSQVRVDMGAPVLGAADIPVAVAGNQPDGRVVAAVSPALAGREEWWDAAGLDPRMTCVSMGNPHVVFYCRDVAAVPLEVVGPRLETAPIFPRRVNVHFVEVLAPDHVRMRTWERGSGITMACGTGACAAVAVMRDRGLVDERVEVHLPGGVLIITDTGEELILEGPAIIEGPAVLDAAFAARVAAFASDGWATEA